jgi:hypothetical protein
MEKVAGILEISRTDDGGQIAIRHPGRKTDANGLSHIVLSPRQARHFASVLTLLAGEVEDEEAASRTNAKGAGD